MTYTQGTLKGIVNHESYVVGLFHIKVKKKKKILERVFWNYYFHTVQLMDISLPKFFALH